MKHPIEAAMSTAEIQEADRRYKVADEAVTSYIDKAFRGLPHTYGYLWRGIITLRGHGKSWKDRAGRRTCIQMQVRYGEWGRLETLIAEAQEHYRQRAANKL